MRVSQILFSQGFGSRRECAGLLAQGWVQHGSRTLQDGNEDLPTQDLVLHVRGVAWPFFVSAVVLLHKPAGYECSAKPRHHPSVMLLLPAPLRQRGVQAVGRLDEDTTGLLLLTDDGTLIHRLTSPKWHVPKIYEVQTRHPVDAEQVQRLCAGVVLHDDPLPARAAACAIIGTHQARMTLTEGRYHQVKRMWAAVGNRVDGLHRSRFGRLALDADLRPGAWRFLQASELALLLPEPAADAADAADAAAAADATFTAGGAAAPCAAPDGRG